MSTSNAEYSLFSLPNSSTNPQQGVAPQNFIIFQFASEGNFSNLLNFTKKIEAGPYLIEIESLTFQNLGNSGNQNAPDDYSTGKLAANFTIKAFTER